MSGWLTQGLHRTGKRGILTEVVKSFAPELVRRVKGSRSAVQAFDRGKEPRASRNPNPSYCNQRRSLGFTVDFVPYGCFDILRFCGQSTCPDRLKPIGGRRSKEK